MDLKKIFATTLFMVFAFGYSGLASAAEVATVPDVPNVDEANYTLQAALPEATGNQIVEVGNTVDAKILKFENLPKVKNISSNLVNITDTAVIIPRGDVFKVAFAQDFTTKNLNVGDKIIFTLPSGLYTQEGRLLLPAGTQLISCVKSYTPPKAFNRNAKVMLDFNEILVPDTTACKMGACVYGKYNTLQRSAWATVAKPVIWTAGLFGVGAGLGAAIGAAAGAVGIGCLAIGMPVGGGVGLIVGLVTPGLHYKAKAGKQIPIMLTEDLVLVGK